MTLIVHKYGGTSVATIERIQAVADHITARRAAGDQLIVTISAMGAQTDELLGLARQITHTPPRRELDMLLTAGERISMALLSMALQKRGIHAVSLTGSQSGILTDETHGNARIHKILGDRIRQGIADSRVVIVAGFQGVSPKTREITTLGRGGSDLSAVAIAAALDAKEVQLYKDVCGVYTADPRVVTQAKLLPKIRHSTLANMAWLGATVLHPRCLHVAKRFGVQLSIRSSYELDHTGTTVVEDEVMEEAGVIAITQKKNMVILNVKATPETIASVMAQGLQILWEHGESPLATIQAGAQWKLVLSVDNLESFKTSLQDSAANTKLSFTIDADNIDCLSIVGSGFQQSPEVMNTIAQEIPTPRLISYRDSDICICLDKSQANAAAVRLHDLLISST